MEATGDQPRGKDPAVDYDYFNKYDNLASHKTILKMGTHLDPRCSLQPKFVREMDNVRTEAYKTAIKHHQDLIKGKVVLDAGCGTGMLAIFCAQAGAKRVYAVDASKIAVQARKVVEENNFSEVISVLHERVEDVRINEEIDVIISEWMGYMLLSESMVNSVMIAKERWLKPKGLILPSVAKLYMAPFTSERYCDAINFWHDVYGIDMSPLIPLVKSQSYKSPWIDTIKADNLLGSSHIVKEINMYSIRKPELELITTSFTFDSNKNAPLHGFAFWFDVEFASDETSDETSVAIDEAPRLSTAPQDPPTHWEQVLLYCADDSIELKKGQIIEGSVTLTPRDEDWHSLNIHLEYVSGGLSFKRDAGI